MIVESNDYRLLTKEVRVSFLKHPYHMLSRLRDTYCDRWNRDNCWSLMATSATAKGPLCLTGKGPSSRHTLSQHHAIILKHMLNAAARLHADQDFIPVKLHSESCILQDNVWLDTSYACHVFAQCPRIP